MLRGHTPYTDIYWPRILVHEHDDSIFVCIAAKKKKVKCNHESINATDLNILITYNKKKNNLEFACILNYYFVNIFSFEF